MSEDKVEQISWYEGDFRFRVEISEDGFYSASSFYYGTDENPIYPYGEPDQSPVALISDSKQTPPIVRRAREELRLRLRRE